MDEKQTEIGSGIDSSHEVQRIRDIIFGAQMKDYDGRFQIVQRDLDRLQEDLDRLSEQLADQDGNQNKKLNQLRRDLRKADDGLRDELRQTAQTLAVDKVDRAVLGELFIELGTHLKNGGTLADLLQELRDQEPG